MGEKPFALTLGDTTLEFLTKFLSKSVYCYDLGAFFTALLIELVQLTLTLRNLA
jgi:hypothetical protein